MENRERDRVSQRSSPTDAGRVNRETSEEIGRNTNSGTNAEFGQSIGRSENLREGGEMDRKKRDESMENESTRRPSDEIGTSRGRSGSTSSDLDRNESRNRSSRDSVNSIDQNRDRSRNDPSEGRH